MNREDKPLEGLTIVDFSVMISGGFATMQMADFGAEVLSVEHPTKSDPLRSWPPFDQGESLWWKSIARNKKSITLDLSSVDGQKIALELVKQADLVFENFRPGTMEKWGLGPEELHNVNPKLIIIRLSGYGQNGPKSTEPGFGTIAEGVSGWANVNGYADGEPLLPPISLADITAALFAVHGAMFALYYRENNSTTVVNTGQVVDVSLYEPLFRLFVGDIEGYDRCGRVPQRSGNKHDNASPRGVYKTKDGYITLSASSQSTFKSVAIAIGRPELIDDDRFITNSLRVENSNEIDNIIENWTSNKSTIDAINQMKEYDAIVGPVYSLEDIHKDEQYLARENIVQMNDQDFGKLNTPSPVPKLSQTPGYAEHAGYSKGYHNEEIYLSYLDMSDAEFEDMKRKSVI